MMEDRYGNPLTTRSQAACDDYCEGLDLFLAAQPGGIERLQRAVATDDQFAIARADLARALQIVAQPQQAREHIAAAMALTNGLTRQEAQHLAIMAQLVGGDNTAAFALIQDHLQDYPRDVMAVQPCCGVFGLIGFSGRVGREAENLAFMQPLARHYAGDWWFESQFAFALCEVGQLAASETLIERALAANPRNANAAHHLAHVHYEVGESAAGLRTLAHWRADYPRNGLLACHLAWHEALWRLDSGDMQAALALLAAEMHPDVAQAPPINVLTDLVALLLRLELAGHPREMALWQTAVAYAKRCFPKPGLSFVDLHTSIALAMTADAQGLALFQGDPAGAAGDLVARIAMAFAAFVEADWERVLAELTPVLAEHERLGGSRAQRDLLELTYGYALLRLGYRAEAARFHGARRPAAPSCMGRLPGC